MSEFHGYPICTLSNEYLELDCLATAGPRIVRLKYKGSENLLAEVPQITVPTPLGDYHYLGGHRVWHAPEALPRSYVPDEDGLDVAQQTSSGVVLNGRVESATGIQKRIEIHLDRDAPRVHLIHALTNKGLWEVELSPWAITMCRLGGIAILPTRVGEGDAQELLPDRHFALWPYSHVEDPRLQLHDEFVLIRALPDLPPFKLGVFNPSGWTAYCVGSLLFRKAFTVQVGPRYPDHNCNAEVYCDDHFVELETLGPLERLAPGASAALRETWEICDLADQHFLSQKMMELITNSTG